MKILRPRPGLLLSLSVLTLCFVVPVAMALTSAAVTGAIGLWPVLVLLFGIPTLLVLLAGLRRARRR